MSSGGNLDVEMLTDMIDNGLGQVCDGEKSAEMLEYLQVRDEHDQGRPATSDGETPFFVLARDGKESDQIIVRQAIREPRIDDPRHHLVHVTDPSSVGSARVSNGGSHQDRFGACSSKVGPDTLAEPRKS